MIKAGSLPCLCFSCLGGNKGHGEDKPNTLILRSERGSHPPTTFRWSELNHVDRGKTKRSWEMQSSWARVSSMDEEKN